MGFGGVLDDSTFLQRMGSFRHITVQTELAVSGCRASPLDPSTPICIDCYMETQHPMCQACHLPLREMCIAAMKKKFHHECFRCCRCHGPIPRGEYYLWNGNPFDEDCFYALKCIRRTSTSAF